MAPGVVTVQVGEAQNLKETEIFGTQDPYAVITIGSQKQKTKVHKDGGKRAVWNETFQFAVNGEAHLTLEVFNKNSMGKDDLIGGGRRQLAPGGGPPDSCWLPISRPGHAQAGLVSLSISSQALAPAGYGAPAVPYGAPTPNAPLWPPPASGTSAHPQGPYPPPAQAYAPAGAYPPPQGGTYPPPYGGLPAGYNPPPTTGAPAQAGYHAYAPPPSGYPVPGGAQGQHQPSGSSGMNMVYAGLAGAALGAGATGAAMYAHGHHKAGKHGHKHKGYKHKGHKHKGYKHKGFKHKGFKHKGFKLKGFGKKWKKK